MSILFYRYSSPPLAHLFCIHNDGVAIKVSGYVSLLAFFAIAT